jgi:hypothetical protein
MTERFECAFVLWCCVTISTWSKESQTNFVSYCVKVLPKLMNCYKKRREVILCLVQRHLNGLNNFEGVQIRWRMKYEVDAYYQKKRANNRESAPARHAS